MKPLKHQEKFVSGYKDKDLLVHEGGTGKTICACLWLKDGRDADAIVVCPKKVKRKWEKALSDWGTKATVYSKEEFKKQFDDIIKKGWSARVVDEADEFAAPLFVAKLRSALATCMYQFVRTYPGMPTLLLTATPVRSTPWNLHTILCYLGVYIPWKTWRDNYFSLEKRPYLRRSSLAYLPKKNWRKLIQNDINGHSDVVLLREITDLPPARHKKIWVPTPDYEPLPDDKPFFGEHRWEQKEKGKVIIDIGRKFRKILVVAYYREQIEELEAVLSKDKETFAIHGGVKDQEAIIEQAAQSDDCYFIVQASIGAGFDADTFSCVVFASMSYAVRDYVQMKFRVRRIHNLHPVKYNYLLGGRCDAAVFRNIQRGKDFVPSEYRTTTGSSEEEGYAGSGISEEVFEMGTGEGFADSGDGAEGGEGELSAV